MTETKQQLPRFTDKGFLIIGSHDYVNLNCFARLTIKAGPAENTWLVVGYPIGKKYYVIKSFENYHGATKYLQALAWNNKP